MGKSSLLFEESYQERTKISLPDRIPRAVSFERIMDLVANEHSLTHADLCGRESGVEISYPRSVAMYLLYMDTALALCEIAFRFNRHTSTANSCIKSIHHGLVDPGIRLEIQELRARY